MFDWCKKVNVYNIDNHYYVYNGHQHLKDMGPQIGLSKLCARPISQVNRRRNSSCPKKGLQLASNIKNIDLGCEYTKHTASSLEDCGNVKLSKQIIKFKQSLNCQQQSVQSKELSEELPHSPILIEQLISTQSTPSIGQFRRRYGVRLQEIDHKFKPVSNTVVMKNKEKTLVNFQFHSRERIHQQIPSTYVTLLHPPENEGKCSPNISNEHSIILSLILSRNDDNNNNNNNSNKICSFSHGLGLKRNKLLQESDRVTLVSRAGSQCSIRVEESIICEHEPKQNFRIIGNGKILCPQYSFHLALEINIGYLVSIKEVGFNNMSMIASEIQIYKILEQEIYKLQCYHSILELYQIQLCQGSYILIKQPYTHTLEQYLQNLDCENFNKIGLELREQVLSILQFLSQCSRYPLRHLHLQDFVECSGIIKLHDLSIFGNELKYSLSQIWEQFNRQILF